MGALLVTSVALLSCGSAQTISLSTFQSKDNYLYTSVAWGTPTQTLKVLLDTTDATSWVYADTVNTKATTFDTAASSTYVPSTEERNFIYHNTSCTIQSATDTLTIGGNSLSDTSFAVALNTFNITDDEDLSGILSVDRTNTILSSLKTNGYIDNESISIDVANEAVHFGSYVPSSSVINNMSNSTKTAETTNEYLQDEFSAFSDSPCTHMHKCAYFFWTFDIEVKVNGIPLLSTNSFQAVIDSASPYITIYAKDAAAFDAIWQILDGSYGGGLHCNYSTRYCSNTAIMSSMTVYFTDVGYNVSIFKEDVLDDRSIQFLYTGETVYNTDTDYVLFLGRPFLKHTMVTLNYTDSTATFYSLKTTTKKLDWTVILIVFASVLAFAAAFFAVYCWKYGKISGRAVGQGNVEEQVSLLRGPVQAVGHGNNAAVNQVSSGIYSGLDEEEDDDYQRQLQQNRLAAIEAQQNRMNNVPMEEERKESPKGKKVSASGKIGSSLGAVKSDDKEAIRQRRLNALQQQAQQQPNDDNNAPA